MSWDVSDFRRHGASASGSDSSDWTRLIFHLEVIDRIMSSPIVRQSQVSITSQSHSHIPTLSPSSSIYTSAYSRSYLTRAVSRQNGRSLDANKSVFHRW